MSATDPLPPDTPQVQRLIDRVEHAVATGRAPDTVPTGFASLDRMLAGGFRMGDLIVLAGDVGSGKSALALALAVRTARLGYPVAFLSGEMGEDRLLERAVALEARVSVDDLRLGRLDAKQRDAVRATAAWLGSAPLALRALPGRNSVEVAETTLVQQQPRLLVVDSLAHVEPAEAVADVHDRMALAVTRCKQLALSRDMTVLALAPTPGVDPRRPDPRPALDDLGGHGTLKQVADVVLALYREEMYRPDSGVEGAAELLVRKNRNGAEGFVDLYFYAKWLRFEDMLDPEP